MWEDSKYSLKYGKLLLCRMELAPRQAAFLAEEMQSIENAEDRYPSERRAAKRIREQAEGVLTE